MKGGMAGIGTDEAAIYRALANKTPEQISAIRTAYKEHYGADLDDHLKGELSGLELVRAQKLLQSDQPGADAAALQYAMSGWRVDKETVLATLANKSADELAKIDAEYAKTSQGHHHLAEDLTETLKGDKKAQAQALAELKGDHTGAEALALKRAMDHLLGGNAAEIFKLLEDKTPTQIDALRAQFTGGSTLDGAIGAALSGNDLKKAQALLEGTRPDPSKSGAEGPAETQRAAQARARADAFALKKATGGIVADRAAIESLLTGKSDAERKAIVDNYPGNLRKDLEKIAGNFPDKAKLLLDHGKLTDVETLHFAMAGMGVDEKTIHETLKGKTKPELDLIAERYFEKYGTKLKDDLKADLSGRDWFDAQLELKGEPTTAAEALARANLSHDHERAGVWNAASRALLGLLNDQGKNLDSTTQRANEFYKQALAENKANGLGEQLTPAQEQRLGQLLGYSKQDIAGYREAKDKVADLTANVVTTGAAVTAAAVVEVGTLGAATPILAAAGAGVVARVATKGALEGNDYTRAAVVKDAAIGLVDGLAVGVGGLAGTAAKSTATKVALEMNAAGLGSVAGGTARRLTEDATYTPDGLERLATSAVTDYAMGAGTAGAMTPVRKGAAAAWQKLRSAGTGTEVAEAQAVANAARTGAQAPSETGPSLPSPPDAVPAAPVAPNGPPAPSSGTTGLRAGTAEKNVAGKGPAPGRPGSGEDR